MKFAHHLCFTSITTAFFQLLQAFEYGLKTVESQLSKAQEVSLKRIISMVEVGQKFDLDWP